MEQAKLRKPRLPKCLNLCCTYDFELACDCGADCTLRLFVADCNLSCCQFMEATGWTETHRVENDPVTAKVEGTDPLHGDLTVPLKFFIADMSSDNRVVRGVVWKREEVSDLLQIWGEARVQELLSQGHRNLLIFEQAARDMAERGHRCSATECRTKTKSLRREFKKACAHNAKSGNTLMKCQFFDELNAILHCDASVNPPRVAWSLQYQPSRVGEGSSQASSCAARNPDTDDSVANESISEAHIEAQGEDTLLQEDEVVLKLITAEEEEGNVAEPPCEPEQPPVPGDVRDLAGAALRNPAAPLSPASRIRIIRRKRQRTDRAEAMFRDWLQQERNLHEEDHNTLQRDIQDTRDFPQQMLGRLNRGHDSLDTSVDLMREMTAGMTMIAHDF